MTEFGNPRQAPSPISALPPRLFRSEASPKAISGRTSYLRVRLAFHPYPHLIPRFFNIGGFGPPLSVTSTSPWTWVDHPVSGRRRHTQGPHKSNYFCGNPAPCSDSLSLRLRLLALTSQAIVTRRFILQKARRHPSWRLRLLVSTRFQVLFHSPPGVLFTFPSRYWFTIGRQGVFSLGRWSSRIPTGFHVSRGTRGPSRRAKCFGYRAVTVYGRPFQATSPTLRLSDSMRGRPTTPKGNPFGLGCSRFARRYSGNRGCFLFLGVLRCFSSPGLPLAALWIQAGVPAVCRRWVAPFGNPRIKACLRLPGAYRCSPRPSSAPGAKASTVCPSQLLLSCFGEIFLGSLLYPIFKVHLAFVCHAQHLAVTFNNITWITNGFNPLF